MKQTEQNRKCCNMTDTAVMSVISSSGWHHAVRNMQLASVMHNALFWLEKVSNFFVWCVVCVSESVQRTESKESEMPFDNIVDFTCNVLMSVLSMQSFRGEEIIMNVELMER